MFLKKRKKIGLWELTSDRRCPEYYKGKTLYFKRPKLKNPTENNINA